MVRRERPWQCQLDDESERQPGALSSSLSVVQGPLFESSRSASVAVPSFVPALSHRLIPSVQLQLLRLRVPHVLIAPSCIPFIRTHCIHMARFRILTSAKSA